MNDKPRRRGNVWEYVILACVAAALAWSLAISRLLALPAEETAPAAPVPVDKAAASLAAQDLAYAVAAMLAGDRPAFIARAERQFEQDTGCRASLYPAVVGHNDADAERLARIEAIQSVRGIYDFVASAEVPAGKGHAAVIVGVQC